MKTVTPRTFAVRVGLACALTGFALQPCAPPAQAVDGVIEINQASASAGAITPGDQPGFPVTINAPGSYRLTSDLSVSDPGTTVIIVNASFVHIDLNGFTIRLPNTWAGDQASCTAEGAGRGVLAANSNTGIVVSNGGVFGAPLHGIALHGANNRVERVLVEQSCMEGVILGSTSLVIDSIARRNRGTGFNLDPNSRISGSIAEQNGSFGIAVDEFGLVEHCVVRANQGGGIGSGVSSSMQSNHASQNGFVDITAGVGSLILDNVVGAFGAGIRGGPTQPFAPPEVGSGGNVVTYGIGAIPYDDVAHVYCDLANTSKVCTP